ncbi:MAG: sensor domain-containing diguanylate cyclase [Deltaproteobacteria bacterium]|nr:sensor domain-containing diguanylate cyclase [Deltaproteobacteria bacterium]
MAETIEDLKFLGDSNLFIFAHKESKALKERFFELYTLYRLSQNLNLSLQVTELFDSTVKFLKTSLNIKDFCFMLLDEECGELKVWKANGITHDETEDITFKLGEGITGIVASTGESILIQDISKDNRCIDCKEIIPSVGSLLAIPMISNGNTVGVMTIHKQDINAFKEDDKKFFSAIASTVANSIDRARSYEKAQKESMIDSLTGLYNRRFFSDSIIRQSSRAVRYGETFSIIMLDIDHFKYFNDTYGHIVGDEILKNLASIIRANIRQSDIVARYGGEEFVILLPRICKEDAVLTAEKTRLMVEEKLAQSITGKDIEKITITLGVAAYSQDGTTPEEITNSADRFMLMGKQKGRNKVIWSLSGDKEYIAYEKRVSTRYVTVLKGAQNVNVNTNQASSFIEIRTEEEWKMCVLKDISKTGFRGEVEFETKIEDTYTGNVPLASQESNPFSMKVVYVKKNQHNRYEFGAEVIEGSENWKKFYISILY